MNITLKVKVKGRYLYWITLSATEAVFPRGPVRATPHGSSVTAGGNRSIRRKPAMLGRVKLDNTPLTYDQGNFNPITAQSQNRTLVTVVTNIYTTTVTPAPHSDNEEELVKRPLSVCTAEDLRKQVDEN